MELLDAFSVFDPSFYSVSSASPSDAFALNAAMKGKEKLAVLANHYGTGDDAPVKYEDLWKEWESFSFMLAEHYKDATMKQVICDLAKRSLKQAYPQLSCLASIALVIPLSTADCERAFSAIKRVKTALRNRLKTATLDCLLRITVEGPELEDFDFKTAVNMWGAKKTEKFPLIS